MQDEHQTSPVTTQTDKADLAQVFAPQDGKLLPASLDIYLDIQLRATKSVPLPDPFQFTVYLAQLANSGRSK
jgi:hypothetical protein